MFTAKQRVSMLENSCGAITNISIVSFSGLIANFIAQNNINTIARSMRSQQDFQYEYNMQAMYHDMLGIDTIFILAKPEYSHINSTMVKQLVRLQSKNVLKFLPNTTHDIVRQFYGA